MKKTNEWVMDGDSWLYSTAVKMQYQNPFLDEESLVSNWTMVRESFDKKYQFFLERNKIDRLTIYLSGKNNFRHKINDTYKANRTNLSAPIHLRKLKDYVIDRYGAIPSDGGEADDYVVSHKSMYPTVTMTAIDKDVINAVAGRHYNFWKEEWIETTPEWAIKFPFMQTIMGDTSDNVIGIKGIGPKTAQKLLSEALEPSQMWDIVVSTYKKHSRTEEEAIMNMRMVNMLQLNHETKELKLWEPSF